MSQRDTFKVPAAFMTNGWIHVLEDSEIALLLMTACGRGRNPGENDVAIPGEVRLRQYGISRDSFEAHYLLKQLGLLHVDEVGRHEDGRAEDYSQDGAHLHRLRLVAEGFDESPFPKITSTIEYLVARNGAPVVRRTLRA